MRTVIIVICCFVLLPFQMLTASARGILENLIVESYGLPNKAKYIDILIFMDEKDEAYIPFNEENMKQYSFDTKTISEYNIGGFISMSCHYKDNITRMEIQTNARGEYLNAFTLERISNGDLSTAVIRIIL